MEELKSERSGCFLGFALAGKFTGLGSHCGHFEGGWFMCLSCF